MATGNFSSKNILGQGGFGVVYKGILVNMTLVAVKRLKDPNFSGEVQFQTELEMISLALHRNLLRLYGFCLTSDERLLVYPYMPNGSVADRLRDGGRETPLLDWSRRMHIALGAARGLVYLHEQFNPKIIHRDVKAANILLDENFEAVVGDFGLAKLLDPRDSHVTTAVRTLYEEKRLEVLIDRDLNGCYDKEELDEVVKLALVCTRAQASARLKMSEVMKVLEGITGQPGNLEDTQTGPTQQCEGGTFSFVRNCSDVCDGSSFIIEAMELSGPGEGFWIGCGVIVNI
ncbi:hypothetical protein LXL04_027372 [Taraxacum kok-saghyz]